MLAPTPRLTHRCSGQSLKRMYAEVLYRVSMVVLIRCSVEWGGGGGVFHTIALMEVQSPVNDISCLNT